MKPISESGVRGLRRLLVPIAACALGASMANANAAESVEDAGKARFMEACAVCHGPDAKGGGPFASMLNKKPVDLTVLAKNNGGDFPFLRVYETIDGRSMPGAHGTVNMPIWGAEWKGGPALGAETAVRGRILEMILYLRSIQE